MNKIKNAYHALIKFNKSTWFLYAFGLSALCYFLCLSYCQVVFANYIYLEGDNLQEYFPFLMQTAQSIRNFENPLYSFNLFLGHNTVGCVGASGQLFSLPFFASVILGQSNSVVYCFIFMVIRVGLSAMTFQLYSVKYINKNKLFCLLFSLCYSLCAFQFAVLYINQIWIDAFWMLPLIILFIRKFLNTGNWIPLCICYFYLFVNNFYMGYIIGIFSFLYFILLFLFNYKKMKYSIDRIYKYFFCVVLSFGVSSFLILPVAYYFLNNSLDFYNEFRIDINLLDIFNQLMIGTSNGVDSYFPYIYSGLLTVLFIPTFFVDKNVKLRFKLFYSLLFALLLISCLVTPIYLFWHAFDTPDSFGYRFAFLIGFLLCSIGCYETRNIKNVKVWKLSYVSIAFLAIYVIEIFAQRKYNIQYQSNTILFLVINYIFFFAIILLLKYYQKSYNDKTKVKGVSALLIFAVSLELIVNGYSEFYNNDSMNPETLSSNYTQWIEASEKALSEIQSQDNDKFYRILPVGDFILNSDMYFGYNGLSDFCSADNAVLRNTMKMIGVNTSPKLLLPLGYTDFSSMLVSEKYKIEYKPFNAYSYYMNHDCVISKVDSYAGMGFAVDSNLKNFEFKSDNAFANINDLAYSMTGIEEKMFYDASSEIELEQNGIILFENEEGRIKIKRDESYTDSNILNIKIPLANEGLNAYIQLTNEKGSHSVDDVPKLLDGVGSNLDEYSGIFTSYIKPMFSNGNENTLYIEMSNDDNREYTLPNINAAYYDESAFEKVYQKLCECQIEVEEVKNGYVHCNIDVPEDSSLVYISIPYEKGWKAYVNGKEREIIPLIGNAFIGLEADKGYNDIELKFITPCARTGLVISIISFAILVGIIVFKYVKKR